MVSNVKIANEKDKKKKLKSEYTFIILVTCFSPTKLSKQL